MSDENTNWEPFEWTKDGKPYMWRRRRVARAAVEHQPESSIHAGSGTIEGDFPTSRAAPEPLPTDAQVAAQDSMFGVLPEVKR